MYCNYADGEASGAVWCCETGCRAHFFRVEQLRQHLEIVHHKLFQFSSFRFQSYEGLHLYSLCVIFLSYTHILYTHDVLSVQSSPSTLQSKPT